MKQKNIGCTGKLNSVDLTIHKGEVIGLGGLLGSGRTETAELLFGVNPITKGEIVINGKKS
ncbi:ATP-binding cassette domain-containing protein [Megamonas funiformis]|uniref:ATP-binding cassette domain-containing protein n=1 Tax=Megamonas funiformis TaxID=437897 RepID=UPI00399B73FD